MPVLEALNYQYRCRYGRHSLNLMHGCGIYDCYVDMLGFYYIILVRHCLYIQRCGKGRGLGSRLHHYTVQLLGTRMVKGS